MSLVVRTPAYVTDLVSLAEVSAKYGYGSEDAANLQRYIRQASSTVSEYFGRELARQEYVETFYRGGGTELRLSCNPVDPESVSVKVNGETITDFVLRDPGAGILFRRSGWPCSGDTGAEVTYKGGFLIPAEETAPGVVIDWTDAQAYELGAWVRPVATRSPLRFECTGAGESGDTEPSWPAVAGETVDDGGVTWTARTAMELPDMIPSLVAVGVRDLEQGAGRMAGLASSEGDGFSETYFASAGLGGVLSADFLARFDGLRARYGRC